MKRNYFKIRAVIFFVMMVTSVNYYSCKSDDEDSSGCRENWIFADEVRVEQQAFAQAGAVFANEPSVANCLAFREAGNDLIRAAEALKDCPTLAEQREACQSTIDSVQARLDELQEC